MRKEDAILKINKLGNVGDVIVKIMKILVVIGFVLTLIGAITVMILPKNLMKLDLGAKADITLNVSELVGPLDDAEKQALLQEFYDGLNEETAGVSMNLNGSEYETVSAQVTDTGLFMETAVETYSVELGDLGIVCVLGIITLAALFVSLLFAGRLCKAFRDCESPFEENVVKQLNALAYSLLPWVILGSLTETITNSIFTNNFNLMIGVDMGMVLIIIFIFVLAYIFKYGAVLQKESDETL